MKLPCCHLLFSTCGSLISAQLVSVVIYFILCFSFFNVLRLAENGQRFFYCGNEDLVTAPGVDWCREEILMVLQETHGKWQSTEVDIVARFAEHKNLDCGVS